MQLFGLPWSTLLPLFGALTAATAVLYVLKLRRRSVPVPFGQLPCSSGPSTVGKTCSDGTATLTQLSNDVVITAVDLSPSLAPIADPSAIDEDADEQHKRKAAGLEYLNHHNVLGVRAKGRGLGPDIWRSDKQTACSKGTRSLTSRRQGTRGYCDAV